MEVKKEHNYPLNPHSKNIYLYPITKPGSTITYNPYFDDLITSFSKHYNIINANSPTSQGIIDIFKNVGKIDYLWLNWIEELIDKKFGFFQLVLLVLLIPYLKIRKVKIIYTLHNKVSHYKKRLLYKKFTSSLILKYSFIIVTHAKEGVAFVMSKNKKYLDKCLFFPHPIKEKDTQDLQKETDLLIWGKLTPYKGVHKFLAHLKAQNLLDKFKIKIAGKIATPEYAEELNSYARSNITIIDDYISDKDLSDYIMGTKIVLFIYNNNSILSSGVLTDTISLHGNVIGPKTGAFLDMEEAGIAETFDDYNDLVNKIELQLNTKYDNQNSRSTKIKEFVSNHTWDSFASFFKEGLSHR